MTIEEAYQFLGLENSEDFKEKKLNLLLKNGGLVSDYFLERRTGKTTYRCVYAALEILKGNNVLYITQSGYKKEIEKKVNEYVWILGTRQQIDYSKLGKIRVTSNDHQGLRLEGIGFSSSTIEDLY